MSSKEILDVVYHYTDATTSVLSNNEVEEMSKSKHEIPQISKDLRNKCNLFEIIDMSTFTSNYSD